MGHFDRDSGNPNERISDREGSRMGDQRTPHDIPAQPVPGSVQSRATYVMGPPMRPAIRFDNGHLDKFATREAGVKDYAELAKWNAMLEGGEALRPDLSDALAAYRHFLKGDGASWEFSYERYVLNDQSGRTTLKNAILSIQWGASELYRAHRRDSFSLTGSRIDCGDSKDLFFPYPATENWQKAIGGHVIWLSGDVTVSGAVAAAALGSKAGTHRHGAYAVTIGEDGAVVVKTGDLVSKYTGALYAGDVRNHWNEFGRKVAGSIVPIADPNRLSVGETLYHIPTYNAHQKSATTKVTYTLNLTLHAEDRYNFNPGQQDIATGIPDEANGNFELTGLGHQFNQYSTLTRMVTWSELGSDLAVTSGSDGDRQRQHSDNRRGRNRI